MKLKYQAVDEAQDDRINYNSFVPYFLFTEKQILA